MAWNLRRGRPFLKKQREFIRRHPTVILSTAVLVLAMVTALAAPYFTADPLEINPIVRLQSPNADFRFGTDNMGRDLFSRTLNGGRISLIVGFGVAFLSCAAGLVVGILSGYIRALDAVMMRLMDGLMAIPDILLAISIVAIAGGSIANVIVAISIPQIPRVARLIRSIVLSVRERPFIEAAICVGTGLPKMLLRHILPSTLAPLLVQGTYVFASAVITEAYLGFIGTGTPPEIPSWGNVIADGRAYFEMAPWIIFFPGFFLTITVLAVNILGDGLRDMLDPQLARRM